MVIIKILEFNNIEKQKSYIFFPHRIIGVDFSMILQKIKITLNFTELTSFQI